MEENIIRHALWSSWSKETAHLEVKESRNAINRTVWQCAVTSMLVQEILWGEIIKAEVPNYWYSHFWNKVDWKEIDFTSDQFTDWPPIFEEKKIYDLNRLMSNNNTNERYWILKKDFERFIKDYENIESEVSICRLCPKVSHFKHDSIYFWKNCSLLFIWEAPARGWWRITWKAWKNEKWKIIPSWRVLQKLLDLLDINLFDVTFTEAIKCFPQDRKILPEAMANCSPIMYKQIKLLDPNALITLWDHATRAFLWNEYKKFWDVVWKEFEVKVGEKIYKLFPIYHPSPISPKSYTWNVPIFNRLKEYI